MAITFLPVELSLHVPSEFILPPLLWVLARKTSWGVIRDQWVVVISLSVLLVVVTIITVGYTAAVMMSGIGFFGAMLIGAAIAPPGSRGCGSRCGTSRYPAQNPFCAAN